MKLGLFLKNLGHPIAYYPALTKITGGVLPCLFLCQMYYWQGRQQNPDGWIYKSQAEIEQETGMGRREQESARRDLKARGLIQERFAGCPRRLEFLLNDERLDTLWGEFLQGTPVQLQEVPRAWKRKSSDNGSNEHSIMAKNANIDCLGDTLHNGKIEHYAMADPSNISIYTENTSETTNRDYNRESPLTPHRGNAAKSSSPIAKIENAADQEEEPKDSTQQIASSCTDIPESSQLTRNPELGKSSAAQLEVIPSSTKAKNSRRGKSALDEQTQAWFLEAYLSNKPSNFTEHRKLSPQVGKKIQELIASHQGQAIEVFASALTWVREQKDDWWRKTAQFSLDNLCTNGKIEQYADKHAFAMQHDSAYRDRVEGRAPSMDAARRQQDTFTDNNGNTIPADSLVARAAAAWASDPFLQMICPDFKL